MPLIKFDILEGKSKEKIQDILDSVHESMVEAFDVPKRDRYQIVYQHKPEEMIIQDTGLGFERSNDVIVISVTSNKRTQDKKLKFYKLVVENLERDCGIDKKDVVFNITENTDADWSFGEGNAQFITGEL